MSQEAFDRMRGSGTFVSTENPNFASERSPRRSRLKGAQVAYPINKIDDLLPWNVAAELPSLRLAA